MNSQAEVEKKERQRILLTISGIAVVIIVLIVAIIVVASNKASKKNGLAFQATEQTQVAQENTDMAIVLIEG